MSTSRLLSLAIILVNFATTDSDDPCAHRDSCGNQTTAMLPSCHCGTSCLRFKDCCKDFAQDGYFPMTDHNSFDYEDYKCMSVSGSEIEPGEETGYFMVDKCYLDGLNGLSCNKTGDILSDIPVSNQNTTYRNARCALCLGFEKFTPWKVLFILRRYFESKLQEQLNLFGNDTHVLETILSFDRPRLLFYPGDGIKPHLCATKRVVDQTPPSLYQNILVCNDTLYKNFDVCLANGCCQTNNATCHDMEVQDYPVTDYKSENNGEVDLLDLQLRQLEVHLQLDENIDNYMENNLNEKINIKFRFGENVLLLELFAADLFVTSPFERCARGVLLYLENMKFGILSSEKNFLTRSEMNNPSVGIKMTISAIHIKFVRLLSLEEFKELTNIQFPVQCSDKESGLQIYGTARVVERRDLFSHFTFSRKDPMERFPTMTSEQNLKQKPLSMDCQNVSLVISSQINGRTDIGSECAGMDDLDETKNVRIDDQDENQDENVTISDTNDGHIQVFNFFLWVCFALSLFLLIN